jgi:beta-lactamase regulating signal transducer with metallopeptidase domain/predicted esterase
MHDPIVIVAAQASAMLLLGLTLSVALARSPARAHLALVACIAAAILAPTAWLIAGNLGLGVLAPDLPRTAAASHPQQSHAVAIDLQSSGSPIANPPSPPARVSEPLAVGELDFPQFPITRQPISSRPPLPTWSRMRPAALSLWALSSGLLLSWTIALICRDRRIATAAPTLHDTNLTTTLDRARVSARIRRPIRLATSDRVTCPVICRWPGRADLIIPASMARVGADWSAIFRHELAHLARHDHLTSLLAAAMCVSLPWNPLAHFAARRLRTLSERAADDWAVGRTPADAIRYAETLVSVQSQRMGIGTLCMVGTRSSLAARVRRVLQPTRRNPRIGAPWVGAIGVGTVALVVGVGLAQQRAPKANEIDANTSDQPESDDPQSWSDETWHDKLTTPGEDALWYVGAGLGKRIALLPGDRALALARANWPDMALAVKTQFLKGFIMAVNQEKHLNPAYFEIMDLGMSDPEKRPQEFAKSYLQGTALLSPDDTGAEYADFRRRTEGMDAEQAITTQVDWLMARARTTDDPADVLDRIDAAARGPLAALPFMRERAIDQGLYDVIDAWIEAGRVAPDDERFHALYTAVGRPEIVRGADALEVFEPILMQTWNAYVETGDDLALRRVIYQLDRERDPRFIPLLIGMIDADNSHDTVYYIGHFALSRITGVSYRFYHDGAWWRRWWEANKASYPQEARDIPVPDLQPTAHAKSYEPFPDDLDTLQGKTRVAQERFAAGDVEQAADILAAVGEDHPRDEAAKAIPLMIGMIDADNSYDTIYGVGYYGLQLSKLTDVDYSAFHDGAWWRRWWEKNKANYPDDVQRTPIPDLPKTAHGRSFEPFPESMETLEGKMAWLPGALERGEPDMFYDITKAMAAHDDPRCIPLLIGLIAADNTEDTIYYIGSFGLDTLTGVKYEESHDGAWWIDWWATNRSRFPADVASTPIPDLTDQMTAWRAAKRARQQAALDAEFEGDFAERRTAPDHDRMHYYLMKAGLIDEAPPAGGYRLVLILPGGAGDDAFNPFCRRITRHALPPGTIAAELVAPAWIDDPDRRVWPTDARHPEQAEFSTEEFIRAVVADVKRALPVDDNRIYTLGWSSSGPALYADAMTPDTPVTGSFIAMSVFWPHELPGLDNAAGKPFYLLHSPDDFIDIDQHPRAARDQLQDAGAVVALTTYSGGHGWQEDPFGHIRRGIEWLDEQIE